MVSSLTINIVVELCYDNVVEPCTELIVWIFEVVTNVLIKTYERGLLCNVPQS